MLANTDKTLAIVILPTVLACSQVGCARIPKIPGAKDPATWSAVIAAISAGVGIRAEARQGDSEARTRDKDKQSNEVAVIIDVPTESQNGVKSKSIFAYVDCRYINDDAAILERNSYFNDNNRPLSSQEKSSLANFLREKALPECQNKFNGRTSSSLIPPTSNASPLLPTSTPNLQLIPGLDSTSSPVVTPPDSPATQPPTPPKSVSKVDESEIHTAVNTSYITLSIAVRNLNKELLKTSFTGEALKAREAVIENNSDSVIIRYDGDTQFSDYTVINNEKVEITATKKVKGANVMKSNQCVAYVPEYV